MAGIKISELTAATAKTGTELIPIIQGGANKSITANVLFSGLYDIANGNIKVTPVATVGFTAIVATESASAGNVNGVNYVYLATFITATGETIPLAASNAISVTNKQVDLTNLPVSPDSRVTGRRIYRQVSGTGAHLAKLVATIANNTATTYTDNVADGSLGAAVPRINTTGGIIYMNTERSIVVDGGLTAIGFQAHPNNTAYACTAIGFQSLFSNTLGSRNTAIGVYALYGNTTGLDNVAIGVHCLNYSNSSFNTAIGVSACQNTTSGANNTAIGTNALQLNTTGGSNTAIGYAALQVQSTGINNVAIGRSSLISSSSGNHNTAVGYATLLSNVSGWYNVALGYEAGYHETGSYKLFIDGLYRDSEANGRALSLIYGVFAAAAADQVLTINAAAFNLPYIPTYADNAAAAAGGLAAGRVYKTATGEMRIVVA